MHSLKKNQQPFYYATYDAEKKIYEYSENMNSKDTEERECIYHL